MRLRERHVGSAGRVRDDNHSAMTLLSVVAFALLPGRPVFTTSRSTSTRARMMMIDTPDRIRRLEAAVAELMLLGANPDVITGLKGELGALKNAALETATQSVVEMAAQSVPLPSDNAQLVAEIRAAKSEVSRSIRLGDIQRIALLRELQIKWHPDKCMNIEDEATKQMAEQMSANINEAMRIARINCKARDEREAYLNKVLNRAPIVNDPRTNPDYEWVNTPWGWGPRKKKEVRDREL